MIERDLLDRMRDLLSDPRRGVVRGEFVAGSRVLPCASGQGIGMAGTCRWLRGRAGGGERSGPGLITLGRVAVEALVGLTAPAVRRGTVPQNNRRALPE